MLDKLTSRFSKYRTNNVYDTYSSQACTVTIDADTLTAQLGSPIMLMTKVDPPLDTYQINFKDGDIVLNPAPITTDVSGMASYSWDTTIYEAILHNITVEVIAPVTCTSLPLMIALTTNRCLTVTIDNSSPITGYIGDVITVFTTTTVIQPPIERFIIEFIDLDYSMRIGSCITPPGGGQCTTNIDTTGTPQEGTYSIVARIGNGAQRCESPPVDAILQYRPGKIVVLSIPPGASIYYDDNPTGMNSSAIISDVTPNTTHTVSLTLNGYQPYTRDITLDPGETFYIDDAILQPIVPPVGTGNLSVTSVPDGVEFGLYTGEIDTAPVTLYDIPTGINAYDAGLTGYNWAMGSFVIKDGETTNLNIPLQFSTPDMGIVAIESIPMGADIYIDGLPINTKTSFMTLMSPGPHTYELRMSGYQNKSGEFTVVTGYDMPAIVSDVLQPSGTGTAMVFAMVGIAVLGMMIMAPSSVGIKEEGVKMVQRTPSSVGIKEEGVK